MPSLFQAAALLLLPTLLWLQQWLDFLGSFYLFTLLPASSSSWAWQHSRVSVGHAVQQSKSQVHSVVWGSMGSGCTMQQRILGMQCRSGEGSLESSTWWGVMDTRCSGGPSLGCAAQGTVAHSDAGHVAYSPGCVP